MNKPVHMGYSQKGAALLLMLLVLILFIGALTIHFFDSAEEIRIERRQQTARVLALAKNTLLNHAIIDAASVPQATPRPGELPCPARQNDGEVDGGAACTLIGWFPWKTLELQDLRDSDGYRLWYAVSEDFRDDGNAEPAINSATVFNGLLRILDASGIETGTAAAVIIAPGSPLPGQTRSASDNIAAAVIQEYLEGTNNDFDDSFTNEITENLNDRIIVITSDELVERAAELAIRQAAATLRAYYATENYYPYPEFDTQCDINTYGPLNPGGHQNKAGLLPLTADGNCPYSILNMPAWFTNSDWDKVIVYMAAPACVGHDKSNCNGAGGFLTLDGQNGIHAMVADSGRMLNDTQCQGQPPYTQTRPWPTNYRICEYLETYENTNNDNIFTQPVVSATTNDRFLIVNP